MDIRRVLVALILALAATTPGASVADTAPVVTVETLIGTWNGRWTAASGGPSGSLELILARVPGRDSVLGQFTFVTGATSRTLRYEGRIENGTLRFPLVGDGRIVLTSRDAPRAGQAATLRGEWEDARGALPTSRGALELDRVP